MTILTMVWASHTTMNNCSLEQDPRETCMTTAGSTKSLILQERPLILWFDEVGISSSWSKNTSLGEMIVANIKGVSVPNGFALLPPYLSLLHQSAGLKQAAIAVLWPECRKCISNLRQRANKLSHCSECAISSRNSEAITNHIIRLCELYGSDTDSSHARCHSWRPPPDASFAGQQSLSQCHSLQNCCQLVITASPLYLLIADFPIPSQSRIWPLRCLRSRW